MSLKCFRNHKGFFSDYYLGSIFVNELTGRKKRTTDKEIDLLLIRFLRIRERAQKIAKNNQETREKFIRPLLRDILGFHLGRGENQIHLLYLNAEQEEKGEKPIVLAYCGSWEENFDAGKGQHNPMHALSRALSDSDLKYGILISGNAIRLIRSDGLTSTGAYLEVNLDELAESENREAFFAFLRLFSSKTFIPDETGKVSIEEIEKESRLHAEKVSDDLKQAVFSAAEALVSGLIVDAIERGVISSPFELNEQQLKLYRDAALSCLYRMLFILYAEARDPRLNTHKIYRDSYSLQGLLDEIFEKSENAWAENCASLWCRIKALFKIYDNGLPRISQWEYIPPRGSNFFSDKTPEGKIINEARLSDKLVVKILLSLATSTPRQGIGRERISFRELDIENLGAVYEGLLEYEPRIVNEPTFELSVQGKTYFLGDKDVVRLCEQKKLKLKGNLELFQGTAANALISTGVNISDEEQEDGGIELIDDLEYLQDNEADENDQETSDSEMEESEEEKGIEKGASAKVIKRYEAGSFIFIPGPAKKGSGSFYTPRALVKDLVRHTLGPLIQGKTAAEIESLRILDPACGSAHFLVEAMRYLGQALHMAYVKELDGKPPKEFRSTTGQGWDTNWQISDEGARAANSEARAWCKRRIAEKCLFGVDLNPTAVQLARVALWIESVAGDRPLTFFEHHIRCGNSLLGTWIERLDYPPAPHLRRKSESRKAKKKSFEAEKTNSHMFDFQLGLFKGQIHEKIKKAAALRTQINNISLDDLISEGIEPESINEQHYKENLLKEAEELLSTLKLIFDLRSASPFIPEIWKEFDLFCNWADSPEQLTTYLKGKAWWPEFEKVRNRERFFHWELEFPEVFLDKSQHGFDVVLGNPPWEKIKPDRREFYGRYDILIRAFKGGELDGRISELHELYPELKTAYKEYEDRIKKSVIFLKKGGDFIYQDFTIDGKSTGGDPDLFKFFVEQAWRLVAEEGRVGFVVPSAIYNNEGCTGLRHLLLEEASIERFYAFENRKKIFPIDSRYKFISLVFKKTKPENSIFEAAFMRHDIEELEETARWREPGKKFSFPEPIPWMVKISKEELKRLSPGTLAFLEYRCPRDREILLKMYKGKPLLGDQGPGTWNAQFYREYDMTNDRDLWTDPKTRKLWNPRQILGPVTGTTDSQPYYDPLAWPEIRAMMAEKGFWPLYEGKHIDQFLVDVKPIERWVNLEAAEKKRGRPPEPGPKLVFRAIASNTNERTFIAAVLPEKSCFGHLNWGVAVEPNKADLLCAILNSLLVDFSLRLRVSLSIGPTQLKRLAIISPENSFSISPFKTISAFGKKLSNIYNNPEYFDLLWKLNRKVTEAYGLKPDDLEYILSTFPVFIRKRFAFYNYLRSRIAEWEKTFPADREYTTSIKKEIQMAADSQDGYNKNNSDKTN
jgi:hypothetical protein